MKRFVTVMSLGLSLVAYGRIASAQESIAPVINADGNSGTSNAGLNPAVDADGPTLIYGDINSPPGTTVVGPPLEVSEPVTTDTGYVPVPGTNENLTATDGDASALGPGSASAAPGTVTRDGVPGTSLLGPDGTYSVTEVSPSNVTVGDGGEPAPVYEEPVYEPVYEPVAEPVYEPAPETVEPVVTETSESDLDGDNYADTLELELGLDPGNPDTDGDGVADGDEVTIYFTDPFTWDSDGDGISDGEELFGILTNPLVWDTDGDGLGDGETVVA
jgi:hypothetical protein